MLQNLRAQENWKDNINSGHQEEITTKAERPCKEVLKEATGNPK